MAKARTRKCAVPCCTKDIPQWLHFCKECYKLAPKFLKNDMHQEYQQMKRAGVRHTQRMNELVVAASAAIVEKLQKKSEKRRKQGGDLVAAAQGGAS